MCGIAGFIDSKLSADKGMATLTEMLGTIRYRGPDAQGSEHLGDGVYIGHNRLSIIDLTADSDQPMHRDGITLSFNGEIYNYLEIREELSKSGVRFKTQSDTEVIIESYRKWGASCVERFVGMWAFVIWDHSKKTLFCSRDRFGIKPFYYIIENGAFYFASEMKALKGSRLFQNRANELQVIKALHLGPFGGDSQTHFSNIMSLPLAHNAIWKDGNLALERYWDVNLNAQTDINSQSDRQEKFKELFVDSMRLHMRSDVEVGGCLSGGLDSGAIASIVGKEFPNVNFNTFNIYYEGKGTSDVDERPWVNEITNMYPSLIPHFFSPTNDDVNQAFERFAHHQDVPVSGSSPLSGYFVMQLASEHGIKVLLNGQGSDEYLAGYMHAFYRFIGQSFSTLNVVQAMSRLRDHSKDQNLGLGASLGVFARSIYSARTDEPGMAIGQLKRKFSYLADGTNPSELIGFNAKTHDQFKDYLYHATFTNTLPTLLHYEDRNSMAFSIESRVPFLDHRLVEFAFSIPDSDKIHKGETKHILRKSMGNYLPAAILNRKDKKGFVTPGELKWLRGPLKHLTEINANDLPMLNVDKTRDVLSKYKAGDNSNAKLVWRLATLNHWLKSNSLN